MCSIRLSCKRFNSIGSITFALPDYWRFHRIEKSAFINSRQTEARFGKGLDEWMTPIDLPRASRPGTQPAYDFYLKLVVIGDGYTGKTSFVKALAKESSPTGYSQTTGWDFKAFHRKFHGKVVKVHLWDLGTIHGRETPIAPFYRNASGCFVFYDITHRQSFDHIRQHLAEFNV